MQRRIYLLLVSSSRCLQRFTHILWVLSFMDDSSCNHTRIKRFALYWFKCLYCLDLFDSWFTGGSHSFGTDSTIVFSHFFVYSHLYNGNGVFSICSKSKSFLVERMQKDGRAYVCRLLKFIVIRIRKRNNRE